MGKVVAGVLLGVFVGAVVVELVGRRNPRLLGEIEERARRTARRALDAFKEGYRRPGATSARSRTLPSE